jgi:dephospho-CoA kinase
MKFVGLSGGIGAGKSTVRARLADRGAETIDVDLLTRELQEPGEPFYEQIVRRWGTDVVTDDGRLDREALGQIVFSDREQLAALTMMAAPITEQEIVRRASAHLGTNTVVVVEAALYLRPMYGMAGLIVVDVPTEVAVHRLVRFRAMEEDDARKRIAAQLPREARLEHAGFVVENAGPPEDLEPFIDAAWRWIAELPDAVPNLLRA